MMRKTLIAAALAAVAALSLGACGNDTGDAENRSVTEVSSQFNDADAAFATDMIPHHQQAVQMAELAADRAGSDQVRQLAEDIEAAQGPEIETMTGWLDAWGQDAPSETLDHGDMGHEDMDGGMPGMMTEDDMNMLEAANGAAFDRDAIALAKQVETDQESEIGKMRQLLDS